jgi:L-fucose mutarotase
MLRYRLLQPDILRALGAGGHGGRVLIADGNYPMATGSRDGATRVYLNLAPDRLRVTEVLEALVDAIPFEAAQVMMPERGPEPAIFDEFRALLPGLPLQPLERFAFYDAARGPDLILAIATGERRIYANLLLTIGVVPPEREAT